MGINQPVSQVCGSFGPRRGFGVCSSNGSVVSLVASRRIYEQVISNYKSDEDKVGRVLGILNTVF